MQRDIAGVLVCSSVLDMLETHVELDHDQRENIAEIYKERMNRRKARLQSIAEDFPEFYKRFENTLFTQVALTAAKFHIEEAYHHGEIGTKVLSNIENKIHDGLQELPSISDSAPKLNPRDLLGTVPLLKGLSTQVLEQLAEHANPVTFLADDIVIGEGERGDALYIITHGIVSVIKGKNVVAELTDGDFFGEMALLGDQVRTATVKAKTPSTLLRLRRRDVIHLADDDPDLKMRLNEIKDERAEQTDLVGTVPLLSGLPAEVLQLVTEQTLAVNYSPGDVVITEGDRDDALYLIIHGAVGVYKNGELVAELRDGDFFGEMALLGDQIRTATVKIIETSTLLKLRRKDIMELSEDSIELKNRLEQAQQKRKYQNE